MLSVKAGLLITTVFGVYFLGAFGETTTTATPSISTIFSDSTTTGNYEIRNLSSNVGSRFGNELSFAVDDSTLSTSKEFTSVPSTTDRSSGLHSSTFLADTETPEDKTSVTDRDARFLSANANSSWSPFYAYGLSTVNTDAMTVNITFIADSTDQSTTYSTTQDSSANSTSESESFSTNKHAPRSFIYVTGIEPEFYTTVNQSDSTDVTSVTEIAGSSTTTGFDPSEVMEESSTAGRHARFFNDTEPFVSTANSTDLSKYSFDTTRDENRSLLGFTDILDVLSTDLSREIRSREPRFNVSSPSTIDYNLMKSNTDSSVVDPNFGEHVVGVGSHELLNVPVFESHSDRKRTQSWLCPAITRTCKPWVLEKRTECNSDYECDRGRRCCQIKCSIKCVKIEDQNHFHYHQEN